MRKTQPSSAAFVVREGGYRHLPRAELLADGESVLVTGVVDNEAQTGEVYRLRKAVRATDRLPSLRRRVPRWVADRGPLNGCYPSDMQRSAAEVLEAALALPEDERAQLAEKLVASLDGNVDPDAEAAWGEEIERRLARIEAGQSQTVSLDESVARLHRIARGG
jgi:putative addiction module component (TIGR02574 family)